MLYLVQVGSKDGIEDDIHKQRDDDDLGTEWKGRFWCHTDSQFVPVEALSPWFNFDQHICKER